MNDYKLDSIKREHSRGDRVIAYYYEGFAIGIGLKGSGEKDRVDSVMAARAEKGEKSGMIVANTVVAIGVVTAVDAAQRTVRLEGVENTQLLEVSEDVDLAKIKVENEIEAVYIKAYAINMIPAPKVSGTVTLESKSVTIGIGVTWDHGMLTMDNGTVHKFKVNGLSLIDLVYPRSVRPARYSISWRQPT